MKKGTLNPKVGGSNPSRPTNKIKDLGTNARVLFSLPRARGSKSRSRSTSGQALHAYATVDLALGHSGLKQGFAAYDAGDFVGFFGDFPVVGYFAVLHAVFVEDVGEDHEEVPADDAVSAQNVELFADGCRHRVLERLFEHGNLATEILLFFTDRAIESPEFAQHIGLRHGQ